MKLLGIGSFERYFEDMVNPFCWPSRNQRPFQRQLVSRGLNLALGLKQEIRTRGSECAQLLCERLIAKRGLQKGK